MRFRAVAIQSANVRKKESKYETEEGVESQNLGEQLKRTDGGLVAEQGKNEPQRAEGQRALTGGCGVWLSNTQTEKVAELSS